MKKVTLLFAGALMALAPLGASAAVRVFVGGPAFGYGYRPYWGPGFYGGYYMPYENTGSVKIDKQLAPPTADVFINGSFAGTVKDNRTMHLRPGSYKIEIRQVGQAPMTQSVFVAAGKTVHLGPAL